DKRRLDIEEARPWVLEDDDEKEVWTGTLEGGQSSSYVLFVLAENGFKVVPVDRWYKFAPKLNYKTLTLDEAEEELQRQRKGHATHDRWIMHRRNPKGEEGDAAGGPSNGESSRRGALVKYEVDDILSDDGDDDDDDGNGGGGPAKKRKRGGKNGGADEVAFEMQFDDDEEMGDVRFEFNEEENNERSEQHNKGHVSIFGTDDEDDSDGDNDRPAGKGTDEQGKRLKKMRKLIRKREGNVDYESDREVNPYLSESEFDSDDSDEEEPAANQDEQQKQQDGEKPAEGDKPAEDAAARPVGSRQTSPRPDSQPSTAGNGASGVKKRKRVPAAPPASSPAGAPSGGPGSAHKHHRASSPSAASTSTLITKQEIVDLIRNGVNTTKDLIGHVRKKLKANPDNKSRIYAILKEVATFKNNHLSLKKP
ncbi:transcription factor IIF subunit tfg1, partial [Coemansia nantahalensis]